MKNNNYLKHNNPQIEILDNTFLKMVQSLDSFNKDGKYSEEEIQVLKQLMIEAYNDKKAEYFFSSRLKGFSEYLNQSFQLVFDDFKDNNSFSKVRLKHSKFMLSNESY